MESRYYFRLRSPLKSPTVRYVIARTKKEAIDKMREKISVLFKGEDKVMMHLQHKEAVDVKK